jgi:hypothetical protein
MAMFTNKYVNKFQKAEAEWVMEILDMHGGDYEKARQAVMDALNRLTKKAEPIAELKPFDDCIAAAFFSSRDWWPIGMKRLAELGLVTMPAAAVTA